MESGYIIRIRKHTIWERLAAFLMLPLRKLRSWLIKRMLALRAKLQIGSLREAIGEADKDKTSSGRKNMVVFNTHSGKYEAMQKKGLKALASYSKNKSNKAMTEGRRKMLAESGRKKRIIDQDRVKKIEQKSLYVTK